MLVGLAAGSGGLLSCSRNNDEVVMRPEGIPLSRFDKKSTAAQVVAGLDLKGRTVLITGATSGLGLETLRVLASQGARVLATGRTLEKARAACASVGPGCEPFAMELESLDSIRACAGQIRALGTPIDILMCNAGIMALPQLEQVNGLEKQFAVNHLGHFLLVNLLLGQVQAAPQGRVVVLTSSAYKWAPPAGIEFDNLSGARDYTPNKAYGQSKTANGLFSLQLAKRLAGTNATSNSVNPGPVDTNLPRHYPGWQRAILGTISGFFLKPVAVGAATQCYVATAPALARVSGQYFEDCNPLLPGGQMRNAALADKLWQVSTGLCAKYLS
jgi:NAD(P)-dependent dehydrogenase (short-subunit alcohol dehydrogenase family)